MTLRWQEAGGFTWAVHDPFDPGPLPPGAAVSGASGAAGAGPAGSVGRASGAPSSAGGTATHRQAGRADTAETLVGLVIDYGSVNERLEGYGTLRYLAPALEAELSTSVDLGGGDVAVPEIRVDVGPQYVRVLVRGRYAGVAAAWDHLAEVLASPRLPRDVAPREATSGFWYQDLGLRTGANALSTGWLEPTVPDAYDRALALLAELDPRRGAHRAVFLTNTATMVGQAFTATASLADLTGSLVVPEDASGLTVPRSLLREETPATLVADSSPFLLSGTGPSTVVTLAAALALADVIDHVLSRFLGRPPESRLWLHEVDGRVIAVVATEEVVPPEARRRLLHTLLVETEPVPDAVLEAAVETALRHDSLDRAVLRRLRGTGESRRPTAGEVRRALADLLACAHVCEPARTVSRYGSLPGYPVRTEPLPVPRRGGRGSACGARWFFSWIGAMADFRRHRTPQVVALGEDLGEETVATVQPARSRHPEEATVVSLAQAVLVVDLAGGAMVIVDACQRVVIVAPDVYQRGQRLRRLLEERLAGVARWSVPDQPDHLAHAHRLARRFRLSGRLGWCVCLAVALAVVVHHLV